MDRQVKILSNTFLLQPYGILSEKFYICSEKEDPIFNMPTLLETSCSWTSDCDLTCWNINGSRAEQAIINSINVSIKYGSYYCYNYNLSFQRTTQMTAIESEL